MDKADILGLPQAANNGSHLLKNIMHPLPLSAATAKPIQPLRNKDPVGGGGFCIRWKGFQGNILDCLGGVKTDEEFVDVTLACDDGPSVHAHKLILASCSPYFRRILRDTACQHPVIILNEVKRDTLDSLMTYMYRGEVHVAEEKLPNFFRTAQSLEIKGIAEGITDGFEDHQLTGPTSSTSPPVVFPPPPPPASSTAQQQQPTFAPQHPVGDLSLLAAAATSSLPPMANGTNGSISKRRKTIPRRLDVVNYKVPKIGTSGKQQMLAGADVNLESDISSSNSSSIDAINLSTKPPDSNSSSRPAYSTKALLNIPNPHNFALSLKDNVNSFSSNGSGSPKIDLPSSPVALDMSNGKQQLATSSPTSSSTTSNATTAGIPASSSAATSPTMDNTENNNPEGGGDMEIVDKAPSAPSKGGKDEQGKLAPVSSSTTPEQMAALLGPSWKSRQPRMCQYCQRMFSNKFNLKQVRRIYISIVQVSLHLKSHPSSSSISSTCTPWVARCTARSVRRGSRTSGTSAVTTSPTTGLHSRNSKESNNNNSAPAPRKQGLMMNTHTRGIM